MSEVVGLFPTRVEAERAIDEMTARGYDVDTMGVMDRDRDAEGNVILEEDYDHSDHDHEVVDEAGKGAAGGAVGGAAVGAGAALLTSAGLLLVPGVGPFLAAGTLAGTLGATAVGAAGGAVLGGATGAIFGAAEDDDDLHETSRYYRDGVAGGQTLVSVDADGRDAEEVADHPAHHGRCESRPLPRQQLGLEPSQVRLRCGAAYRSRTDDLLITNQLLYQLS